MTEIEYQGSGIGWIVEAEEEADYEHSILAKSPEDERNTSEAKYMEGSLSEGIYLAEHKTNSYLGLNVTSKYDAARLGRKLSAYNRTQSDGVGFDIHGDRPVFLKVPKVDPAILTQMSWDSLHEPPSSIDVDMGESKTPEVDREIVQPRNWDKLRSTLQQEEEQKAEPQQKSGAVRRFKKSIKKGFGSIFRRKRSSEAAAPVEAENRIPRQASRESAKDDDREATPSPAKTERSEDTASVHELVPGPHFATNRFDVDDFNFLVLLKLVVIGFAKIIPLVIFCIELAIGCSVVKYHNTSVEVFGISTAFSDDLCVIIDTIIKKALVVIGNLGARVEYSTKDNCDYSYDEYQCTHLVGPYRI